MAFHVVVVPQFQLPYVGNHPSRCLHISQPGGSGSHDFISGDVLLKITAGAEALDDYVLWIGPEGKSALAGKVLCEGVYELTALSCTKNGSGHGAKLLRR